MVRDAKGRPVETANMKLVFEISGAGTIIGMGNGNHNNHEPEKGNEYSLYNGLAQVIIQSKANSQGQVVLTVKGEGLQTASVVIMVKETVGIPAVQ